MAVRQTDCTNHGRPPREPQPVPAAASRRGDGGGNSGPCDLDPIDVDSRCAVPFWTSAAFAFAAGIIFAIGSWTSTDGRWLASGPIAVSSRLPRRVATEYAADGLAYRDGRSVWSRGNLGAGIAKPELQTDVWFALEPMPIHRASDGDMEREPLGVPPAGLDDPANVNVGSVRLAITLTSLLPADQCQVIQLDFPDQLLPGAEPRLVRFEPLPPSPLPVCEAESASEFAGEMTAREPSPNHHRLEVPLASDVDRATYPPRLDGVWLPVRDLGWNDPRSYEHCPCALLAESQSTRVYADASELPTVDATKLQAERILHWIDDELRPRTRAAGGPRLLADLPVSVFLSPRLAVIGAQSAALPALSDGPFSADHPADRSGTPLGSPTLDAFVRPSDFLEDVSPPLSHRQPLIYLRSGIQADDHLATVLAHEWAHVLSAAARAGRGGAEEDWLSEGLAHELERRWGRGDSNIASRRDYFLRHPERSPLIVVDSAAAGRWREPGCRGAAATFCEVGWSGLSDERLLRALCQSETGVAGVELATGRRFADLLDEHARQIVRSRWQAGLDQPAVNDRSYELSGSAVAVVDLPLPLPRWVRLRVRSQIAGELTAEAVAESWRVLALRDVEPRLQTSTQQTNQLTR